MDVRQHPFLSRRKSEIHKQILNKTWRRWQAMAPHPILLPCALAFPLPSHRVRADGVSSLSDETPSALTPPLHSASILQPAAPPQVVAFESWTISAPICLNCFTFAKSQKSDL